MNNNPMGYNQGMDSNVFGTNILRNDGTQPTDMNPTLSLLNQGSNSVNPTLDLLNQSNPNPMSDSGSQFRNSGNPTLDLLNESGVQAGGNYNFIPPAEEPASQPANNNVFGLSNPEPQQSNFGGIPAFQNLPAQPTIADTPVSMPVANPMMNMQQPSMAPQGMPQMVDNVYPQAASGVGMNPMPPQQPMDQQPMMPQQMQQPQMMQQPMQPVNPEPVRGIPELGQEPAEVSAPVRTVAPLGSNLNFSFIPLREEEPAPAPQVQQPVVTGPTAAQVFGQTQVMAPTAMPQQQPMDQQPMMPQQMQQPQMMQQPMMGMPQAGYGMQTGVVQQSLDALFPGDNSNNFPQ